jgi:hypothetical protein
VLYGHSWGEVFAIEYALRELGITRDERLAHWKRLDDLTSITAQPS